MDRPANQRPLDAVDALILRTLQEDGRVTWASLAETIGMSAPSATERVRRLDENGYLKGIRANLDPETLGYPTLGFVLVSIRDLGGYEPLLERIGETDAVQEFHVVAGEYDYLLKVRARSPEHLADLIRDNLRSLPGVQSTNTIMVLRTVRETHELPVPSPDDDG